MNLQMNLERRAEKISGEPKKIENKKLPTTTTLTTNHELPAYPAMKGKPSYWIIAHYWDQVVVAVDRGFVTLGVPPFRRLCTLLQPGDHVLYFILRRTRNKITMRNKTKYLDGGSARIRSFAFPGIISTAEPYQIDAGFHSDLWRRDVDYDERFRKEIRPFPSRVLESGQFGFYRNPNSFDEKIKKADGVLRISGEEFEGFLEAMEVRERVLRERKTMPNLEGTWIPDQDEELVFGESLDKRG
jgi:hypothetical protein